MSEERLAFVFSFIIYVVRHPSIPRFVSENGLRFLLGTLAMIAGNDTFACRPIVGGMSGLSLDQ